MDSIPKDDVPKKVNSTFEASNVSFNRQSTKKIGIATLDTVARGLTAPEGKDIVAYGADHYNDSIFRNRPTKGDDYELYKQQLKEKGEGLKIVYGAIARDLAQPMNKEGLWRGNKLVVVYQGAQGDVKTLSVEPYGDSIYLEAFGESRRVDITMQDLREKMKPFNQNTEIRHSYDDSIVNVDDSSL